MKERPINLRSHEVLAILQGRKTQLRRVVKPQPSNSHLFQGWVLDSTCGQDVGKAVWAVGDGPLMQDVARVRCPFGQVGDRLWVRETFDPIYGQSPPDRVIEIDYRADHSRINRWRIKDDFGERRWTPSIRMPRWASRILLEVVSVRVERLHDISEADAQAEGAYPLTNHPGRWLSAHRPGLNYPSATAAYRCCWESVSGNDDSWDKNPWVWVVEFRVVK